MWLSEGILAILKRLAQLERPWPSSLALMRQKRRALHEEHREGGHADVVLHAVGRLLGAAALVRESVQAPSQ